MAEAEDDPRELQAGDTITFSHPELGKAEYEVSDTSVKDMGLAEVFAASLVCGCDRYSLAWVEGADDVEVENLESEEEYHVAIEEIVIL